jgi:hypothetical protein
MSEGGPTITMRGPIVRALVVAAACAAGAVVSASPAAAHEVRSVGKLEMVVGFGTEPAYAGYPNSVQLQLSRTNGSSGGSGSTPVTDVAPGDVAVEVAFGERTEELELEPFCEVGEVGEPGDYRAWFIPTRPGAYTFTFSGRVDGERIDESFTAGPETFSEVESPSAVGFPAGDPTTGELAERLDREVPRLLEAVAEARRSAEDDAGTATTLAIVALVVAGIGVVAGIVGLSSARRRGARP